MNNPNFIVLFKAEPDSNLIVPMLVCGDDMYEDSEEREDTYIQEVAIDGKVYDAVFHSPHESILGNYVVLYEYDGCTPIRTCEVVKIQQVGIELK